MRLQVKELIIPSDTPRTSDDTNSVSVNTNQDNFAFICELNRAIGVDEEEVQLTVQLYSENVDAEDDEVIPLDPLTTTMNAANTVNGKFYFTLVTNHSVSLQKLYVHAYVAGSTIELKRGSFSQPTIKLLYFDRPFKIDPPPYWSSSEAVSMTVEKEDERKYICKNEDAFLHIKGEGLIGAELCLTLLEDDLGDDDIIYQNKSFKLLSNYNSIAFKMSTVIAEYKLKTTDPWYYVEGDELELKVEVKKKDDDTTTKESLILKLDQTKDSDSPTKETNTGLVITWQGSVEDDGGEEEETEEEVEYTNFVIGSIGRIGGVGRVEERARYPDRPSRQFVTTYPMHIYDLYLRDLVENDIITRAEARVLTLNVRENELYTPETMVTRFSKFTGIRVTGNSSESINQILKEAKTINSSERSVMNSGYSRKLLCHVENKGREIINTQVETQWICRDGWQETQGEEKVPLIRPDQDLALPSNSRYFKYRECPPGEYFLVYNVSGGHQIYLSHTGMNDDISSNIYIEGMPITTQGGIRGEVALHRGSAFFAVGCLTLNVIYNGGRSTDLINLFYPTLTRSNSQRLNIICLDERNAQYITNDIVGGQTYHRWYDLVNPYALTITNIEIVRSNENTFILSGVFSKTDFDSEELKYFSWKEQINRVWVDISNSSREKQITYILREGVQIVNIKAMFEGGTSRNITLTR